MVRNVFVGAMIVLASSLVMNAAVEGKSKELTIKAVMLQTHRAKKGEESLLARVLAGNASKEDRAKLVELYSAMAKCTPPVGDAEAWKERTKVLVDAAKGNDFAALKKASNCAGCHNDFRKKLE